VDKYLKYFVNDHNDTDTKLICFHLSEEARSKQNLSILFCMEIGFNFKVSFNFFPQTSNSSMHPETRNKIFQSVQQSF
jgi:hypothetical protein